jgi:hypothetical protein
VSNTGAGSNNHPGSGDMSSPTKFEIFAMKGDRRVITTQCFEQVGANQRDRPGDEKNVTHRIVLLLIKITKFDIRSGMTESVSTHTYR